MNSAQTEQFATAVANAVSQYGLDGVDFDDEWLNTVEMVIHLEVQVLSLI